VEETPGTVGLQVRPVDPGELDALTDIWHDGWRDAHESIVPAALARLRTRDSFRARLRGRLGEIRVAGPPGRPVGFHILASDEVYQFYVAASARGRGVAAALMADAEARLASRGVATAWLACAVGNHRAARFYEKCGWRRAGTVVLPVETTEGEFLLDVWRYEKELR
jgi:GNAT superfamily N-acetyltransferase